ncbi:MAG: metallophosphoesterase family protein [Bacillota bacterium]
MRVALIADIHANLPALEAVWKSIETQRVDQVLCLGDLVGYYPWPNEVIDFIRIKDIATIQGNYDEGVGEELIACGCDFKDEEAARLGGISLDWAIAKVTDENKLWLRNLPQEMRLEIEGRSIWLVHGSPRRNNEYLTAQFPEHELASFLTAGEADILLCAHTHLAYHRQVGDGHVINVGSAGKPKHGNPNVTYVMMQLDQNVSISVIEVPYDHVSAATATAAAGLPEAFAQILRTGKA